MSRYARHHPDDPNMDRAIERADHARAEAKEGVARCNCGAPPSGRWAGIHSPNCAVITCPFVIDDPEGRIHAIAVKHGIVLPEHVVRDMVRHLLEGVQQ